MKWIPCPKPVAADVIRWKEPVWAEPTKKRGKPDKAGEQMLTAEVKAVGEYYELLIQAVEVLSVDEGAQAQTKVKVGDNVKRKVSTIESGDCERLS